MKNRNVLGAIKQGYSVKFTFQTMQKGSISATQEDKEAHMSSIDLKKKQMFTLCAVLVRIAFSLLTYGARMAFSPRTNCSPRQRALTTTVGIFLCAAGAAAFGFDVKLLLSENPEEWLSSIVSLGMIGFASLGTGAGLVSCGTCCDVPEDPADISEEERTPLLAL